jgi:hypothetical protein
MLVNFGKSAPALGGEGEDSGQGGPTRLRAKS